MDEPDERNTEVLRPGVTYVRGWSDARDAARELAEELHALGLDDDFAYLQGDVSALGKGFVRLGMVTSDGARRFARALALGICLELDALPCADEPSRDDRPSVA